MSGYIKKIIINGLFEDKNNYKIDLVEGCNCLFGDNGCGKTSIINLIVHSLTVNLEGIRDIPFKSISLFYAKSGTIRALKLLTVSKSEFKSEDGMKGINIEFTFHPMKKTFTLDVTRIDLIERQYSELIEHFKKLNKKYINLTHVPLLRLHEGEVAYDDDLLNRALRRRKFSQKQISELLDPSVRTLVSLEKEFIEAYTDKTRRIKDELDSLKSRIIEKVMIDEKLVRETTRSFALMTRALEKEPEVVDVNAYVEKFNLAKLDVPVEKVKEHFGQWKALNERFRENWQKTNELTADAAKAQRHKVEKEYRKSYFNLFSITHIYNQFESIIKEVEGVQKTKSNELKTFIEYENQINNFFKNKTFFLSEDGEFSIKSGERKIDISDLSSGEKHILTILGRVALSNEGASSFIADEPELSLHLDWQRKIIPAIRTLSPNTQVIVATHSPAIFENDAKEINIEECRS
ncbi:hypothetical protein FE810_15515 [Thalassotalea litorea]|uniref:Endonuclease GajA/Old nuclease/RecF-like AAA domain-containing protein n=1 Tax=Thalassotalea litorea TaxID=2020715 RepID=A0A5R9IGG5_9GAMM|nr:AAA family ATPase [Thalassotalea litorea]TLU61228.1 hypothetical protein FE810_15515 [Thalassotalea litorea]